MQIAIELHGDDAHQQAALRRDLDAQTLRAFAHDQPGIFQRLEALQVEGKGGGGVHFEFVGQRGQIELEIAHQPLNGGASQVVFGGEMHPARRGQLAESQHLGVFIDGLGVLRIAIADVGNAGHAKGQQIEFGLRGVALEIAVQLALALGAGELVARLGEVIHADVDITRFFQPTDGQTQQAELDLGRRQVFGVDAALRLENVRQMRVAVEREPVGRDLDHLIEGAGERIEVLQGQAVDQVEADGAKTVGAGSVDHQPGFFHALDAIDRLLYLRCEILHAHAHAVEAEPGEMRHARLIHLARVDLDGEFAAGLQVEMFARHGHQPRGFLVIQKGGRAAAPVQLGDGQTGLQEAGDQPQLLFHAVEIGRGAAVILGGNLVAAAVVAQGLTERHMEIQRHRLVGTLGAASQFLGVVARAETGVHAVGGRVGGVTRAGDVETLQQLGLEVERLIHHND